MENSVTIQGKPESEMRRVLSELLSEKDVSFKKDSSQAYVDRELLLMKARDVLGFNWETHSVPLNAEGDLFRVSEYYSQVIVTCLVRTVIKYDNGDICCSVSETGVFSLDVRKDGKGYNSIVDAVKSAQTVGKKMGLMEFINDPVKQISKEKAANPSNDIRQTEEKNEKYHVSVTKAGTLLRNGMIKADVSLNGVPKILTIYKDDVGNISGNMKLNPEALAHSLLPGVEIDVVGRFQTYNKEEQIVISTMTVSERKNDAVNSTPTNTAPPTNQIKDEKDVFSLVIIGESLLLDNGMVHVPCTLDGQPIKLVIYSAKVKSMAEELNQPKQAVADAFTGRLGKTFAVKGAMKSYGNEKQIIYQGVAK